VSDLTLLLDSKGRFDRRVQYFLQEQVLALKEYEQAKKVQAAKRGAQRVQRRMRDILMEGDFRQAYFQMSFDQALHGVGYIRFPYWVTKPVIEYTDSGDVVNKFNTVPMFKHVSVHDFFPLDDAADLQTNTGNTEIMSITQAQLIACAKNKDYDAKAIAEIITEYEYRNRDWVWINETDRNDEPFSRWGLDEPIQIMIHEGYFSGRELSEYGITSVDNLSYVNARVEVCGGRTIRCSLIEAPNGEGRTYFMAPFMKTGNNIFDTIGLAAMLWDTEQRVNRLLHQFEYNIDWASRPPNLVNPAAFQNSNDIEGLMPGMNYTVEDRFGMSGAMPEPLRAMKGPSAQYHLIMTQIQTLLRMADEDCGIPAFAYSSQDYGRSSLGEYSQRMSNALRTVKGMTIQEDLHFIEPAFENLFQWLMKHEPELREEQDINLQVRGMTGLLKEDLANKRQTEILPMLLQLQQSGMPDIEQAVRFAVRQTLDGANIPVDALGMSDPILDNALAVAAQQPITGVQAATPQAPVLDGRSKVPQSAISQPSGISNLNQMGPIAS